MDELGEGWRSKRAGLRDKELGRGVCACVCAGAHVCKRVLVASDTIEMEVGHRVRCSTWKE